MSKEPFPSFDDFVDGLGSWKEPLANYTKSKTFQNIYKYVKAEYESGKKVFSNLFLDLPTKGADFQCVSNNSY